MKNYTITVNGNVYDVTVEENGSTGAAPVARKMAAAPKAAPAVAPKQQRRQVPAALRSKQKQPEKYSKSKPA
mgnify:CR=1 FL=1